MGKGVVADQGLWFKLWCASLDDPDLDNLELADFARWVKLGALIKRHGTSGEIHILPPARALCAMLQVPDYTALLSAFTRLPGLIIATAPVRWPHGNGRPPETEGQILFGSWYVNGRGSEGEKVAVATHEVLRYGGTHSGVSLETSLFVSFRNWLKYQGDLSTQRVRKFREMKRSRGEEKRRDKKRKDSPLPPSGGSDDLSITSDGRKPPTARPETGVESVGEVLTRLGMPDPAKAPEPASEISRE